MNTSKDKYRSEINI